MEAEYVAACEAAKEAVWLKNFLSDLGVMRMKQVSITLFCDNSGAIGQSKIQGIIRKESTSKESIILFKTLWLEEIDSANNLANPFTKALPQKTFESRLEGMGIRLVCNSL